MCDNIWTFIPEIWCILYGNKDFRYWLINYIVLLDESACNTCEIANFG